MTDEKALLQGDLADTYCTYKIENGYVIIYNHDKRF